MSKRMHTAPIWLGGACSMEAFLSDRLAVVTNNLTDRLCVYCHMKLKYVQAKSYHHKHVEALNRNNCKIVQETLSSRGGKLR